MSVVIPVYRGEDTLPEVLAELADLTQPQTTPEGRSFQVHEVLLVWDRGPGQSDATIRELTDTYSWVKPVWLSRNFGQHAATLAGMTSSGGDWIVTMDEDGQQDPAFIAAMLDTAYRDGAQLVYGAPTNPPPHSTFRNAGSRFAKKLFAGALSDGGFAEFNSYRLILGEIRGVEAFDLMHALNTGHGGCLSTVHANSPIDALHRLESLAVLGGDGFPLEAVQRQMARAMDVIVQVERRPDGAWHIHGRGVGGHRCG